MKKSLFLLPLTTALFLTACSSDTNNAPVESETSSATSTAYDLQTEVQSTSMPSSMSGPAPVYQQPQPVSVPPAQPVPQPTYNQPAPMSSAPATGGDAYIPRDAEGKPIYSQMMKGSYTGSSYTVQKGDTMYLIGFISGKGADEIARLNNLTAPYQLRVGQTLRLQ